jgi:FtsP/CotA-like multicopper oxidase with cupredoxin domain
MNERRIYDRPPLRRLLRDLLGAAALSGVVLAGLSGPRTLVGAPERPAEVEGPMAVDTPRTRLQSVATPNRGDSLREPAVIRPLNGVLNARLVVDTATLTVPRSDTSSVDINLRTYKLASTTDPSYAPGDPRFRPAFPGPTFRVQRGDLVRINLVNNLPNQGADNSNEVCKQATMTGTPLTIPDVFQGCFHGFDFTNIHYHGMHVTPDSTSTMVGDDVLLVVAPRDSMQYSFRIPTNQSPGTHWYHPHKHGSVAVQVANGMAGAFIVEDTTTGLDSIVKHLGMVEHLIAVQQVAATVGLLSGFGELDGPAPLVNGQYQPTIYMAPGEVQRWRIVNENTTRTTKTFDVGFTDVANVNEPRLFDIARDGVQFAPRNYQTAQSDPFLHMAPGQRLDVFVQAPTTMGTHFIQVTHNAGASRLSLDPTLPPDRDVQDTNGTAAGDAPALVLFKVVVDPGIRGRNTTLPNALPPLPDFLSGELPQAGDTAVIVFTDSLKQQPTQFYLGSSLNPYQRFDDHSVFVPSDTNGVAMPMVLDSTQTWKIVNNSEQGISHPFHIHINPFQVNRVVYPLGDADPFHELFEQLNAAAERGSPIWLDVLPLPLPGTDTTMVDTTQVLTRVPAYAVITQKYDDFDGCPNGSCGPPFGAFVMHCHILGHEERGMMQVLQVLENAGDPVSHSQGHGAHSTPGMGAGGGNGQGGGGQGQRRANPQSPRRR